MNDPIEALEHRCTLAEADLAFYKEALRLALTMVRDEGDRYGAGNMMSQWTGPDIADDIIERIGLDETEL